MPGAGHQRLDAVSQRPQLDVELQRMEPVGETTRLRRYASATSSLPAVSRRRARTRTLACWAGRVTWTLFRQPQGGISHSPDELTSNEDVEL